MKRLVIVLAAAFLVLALLVGLGPAEDPESDARTTIFAARDDISAAEFLAAEHLRLEMWPADKVPDGAFTRIEDVEGRRTRTKLYAGEPILENRLLPKGSEIVEDRRIPEGYRVVVVKDCSFPDALAPGDRVDVSVNLRRDRAKAAPQTRTRTILQNVKIFSVNRDAAELLMPREEVEKVLLAAELGEVRLALRNPRDPFEDRDRLLEEAAELMQQAAERLHDASVHDLAEDLQREAERIEQEVDGIRENQELREVVGNLEREIHRLRRDLDDLRRRMEQL